MVVVGAALEFAAPDIAAGVIVLCKLDERTLTAVPCMIAVVAVKTLSPDEIFVGCAPTLVLNDCASKPN